MPTLHGPTDPGLWLTRKLGYYESKILGNLDNRPHHLINTVTQINAPHIDPLQFEEAIRAVIYNEPNFRADVRKGDDGALYWCPATDFSDIFRLIDQSERQKQVAGYQGCWDLAEEISNTPLEMGTGRPLNRHYLVKRRDCYVMMNVYHHACGDGTTGMMLVNAIVEQYDRLVKGQGAQLMPSVVMESSDTLSSTVQDDAAVEAMVEARAERARTRELLLPPDWEEVEESQEEGPWINRSLHALGTRRGFDKLHALCKTLGVTIGSFSFAAMFLSEAAVYLRKNEGLYCVGEIPTQFTDVMANLRRRLEPPVEEALMLCIAKTEISANVGESLFALARDIQQQLRAALQEKKYPLYAEYMVRWREGRYKELCDSVAGKVRGILPSNQVAYNYPTTYPWGKIVSLHTTGSYWCPYSDGSQVLLYHSVNKVMCYTIVCCEGQNNVQDAQDVLDTFVGIMENVNKWGHETGLMDLL